MPVHDDLGVRMKTFYEQIPKTKLMRRCPVLSALTERHFIHSQGDSRNRLMKC